MLTRVLRRARRTPPPPPPGPAGYDGWLGAPRRPAGADRGRLRRGRARHHSPSSRASTPICGRCCSRRSTAPTRTSPRSCRTSPRRRCRCAGPASRACRWPSRAPRSTGCCSSAPAARWTARGCSTSAVAGAASRASSPATCRRSASTAAIRSSRSSTCAARTACPRARAQRLPPRATAVRRAVRPGLRVLRLHAPLRGGARALPGRAARRARAGRDPRATIRPPAYLDATPLMADVRAAAASRSCSPRTRPTPSIRSRRAAR